jgi:hypothetical protein
LALHKVSSRTTSPETAICDSTKAARLANAAENAGDAQDFAGELSQSRAAAEMLGTCADGAGIGDNSLYQADKAEMLAVAGLASASLRQKASAGAYLRSARNTMARVSTTSTTNTDLAMEMTRANQAIRRLATVMGEP